MSLLTSLCAIRVANVPEVCVEVKEKKEKKKGSRLRAHERRGRNSQERREVRNDCDGQAGSGFVGPVRKSRTRRLAGGLTDGGVGQGREGLMVGV